MKVLLISVQGIGNSVLLTPAIKFLFCQGYDIDMIVSNNGSHKIIESLGMVKHKYIFDEKQNFTLNALRLRNEAKNNLYDSVYAMYPDGKRENIIAYLIDKRATAGIKDMRGYYRMGRFLIQKRIKLVRGEHDILSNLRLVQAPQTYNDYRPIVDIPCEVEARVNQSCQDDKGIFFLAVHPFSNRKNKQWPMSYFEYVCRRCIEEKGMQVKVFAAPEERASANKLVGILGEKATSFIQEDITYAAAMLKKCKIFLGNDSSLAHIASSLGVPSVCVFGFTDFLRTAPYGENTVIVQKETSCSPCYSFEYGVDKKCKKNFSCLQDLNPGGVYEVVSLIIDRIKAGGVASNIQFGSLSNVEKVMQSWAQSRIIVFN